MEEISSNPLSLHYTLAWPEKLGIPKGNPSLPTYHSDDWSDNQAIIQKHLLALKKIDYQKLNDENQYTHALMQSYFNRLNQLNAYPYYDSPFSPVNGIHSQFPILLSEYAFRSKKDVEDYLCILGQTDEYFLSLLTYQKDKTKAGLATDDFSLSLSSKQCLQIFPENTLSCNSHFLQTSFEEKITQLYHQGLINTKEYENYLKENFSLLIEVVQPAYQLLSQELCALMQNDNSTPSGLCAYPKGKEYYSHLVHFQTGSSASITEMKNTLEKLLASYRVKLNQLLTSDSNSLPLLDAAHKTNWFKENTLDSMLTHLSQSMEQFFPPFPGETTPMVEIKKITDALSSTSAPAFYLTPPIDEFLNNTIYLNPNSSSDSLTLYTTLAHEGYPGHLYQTVYYSSFAQQHQASPLRQVLNFEGYQEGWALYVELLSYDNLSKLASQNGSPNLTLGYEIEKHNRMMQLCLYSLIDIYIHYEGYTLSQIQAYLASMGISDQQTAISIYQYIANAPGNYIKYFWSYLEILSLKKQASLLWKEQYSDLAFHQFFLERGPSDFASLSNALARKKSLKLPSAF